MDYLIKRLIESSEFLDTTSSCLFACWRLGRTASVPAAPAAVICHFPWAARENDRLEDGDRAALPPSPQTTVRARLLPAAAAGRVIGQQRGRREGGRKERCCFTSRAPGRNARARRKALRAASPSRLHEAGVRGREARGARAAPLRRLPPPAPAPRGRLAGPGLPRCRGEGASPGAEAAGGPASLAPPRGQRPQRRGRRASRLSSIFNKQRAAVERAKQTQRNKSERRRPRAAAPGRRRGEPGSGAARAAARRGSSKKPLGKRNAPWSCLDPP